jgi:fatty-acyl-CoA synthase
MQMQAQGIGFWLTKREDLSGEKIALVDGDRTMTYAELNRRVNRLSHALQGLGVKYGDRIGILSYNRYEFLEAIMAAAKLGAIVVPLNWRLTAVELAFILSDSGTEALFFDASLAATAMELKDKCAIRLMISIGEKPPGGVPDYEDLLAKQPEKEPEPDQAVGLDTPHIIMYTAGTTGKPKGAVLSQGASFWNAINVVLSLDLTSADKTLIALPMFHIGGIGLFTLPVLYVGGTVVIMRAFDPARALDIMEKERISVFMGVPAIFLFLAQNPEFGKMKDVRVIMSGGAPLPVSLIRRYDDAGLKLRQGFGMSEAAPSIAILDGDLYLRKAGSIGKGLMHLDVRVVDENMNDMPPNEAGELVMKGPNVMQGYWNRPDATKEAFAGGWFHSGDVARMDEDGFLYIVDRKKDMFISGGENVYPAEVENAIYEIPEVGEAAVIGLADAKWGEVGCAVVALKPGKAATEESIIAFLKSRLAKYKVPRKVEFIDALPRNAAGKVLKNELRRRYS